MGIKKMSKLQLDDEMRADINARIPKTLTAKEKKAADKLAREMFSYNEEQRYYELVEALGTPLTNILKSEEAKKAQDYGSPLTIRFDKIYTRIQDSDYSAHYEPSVKKYLFLQLSKKQTIAFDCDLQNNNTIYSATYLKPNMAGFGIQHKVWICDTTLKPQQFSNQDELNKFIKPVLAQAIAENTIKRNDRKLMRFSKLGAFALAAGLVYSCSSDAAELPQHNNLENSDPYQVIEP